MNKYIAIYDISFVFLTAVCTVTSVWPGRQKMQFDSRHRIQPGCGVYLASAISLCSGEQRGSTGRKYILIQNNKAGNVRIAKH
jgi:hypothetical protein